MTRMGIGGYDWNLHRIKNQPTTMMEKLTARYEINLDKKGTPLYINDGI